MSVIKKRNVDEDFFYDLKDGELKDLVELVRCDDTLCLELRGNNVVIYYRGGALYTIEKKDKAYEISFNDNYTTDKDIDQVIAKKRIIDVDRAISDVGNFKVTMDKYFSKHKKYEREFQQLILRENNYTREITDDSDYYILDIEYAFIDDDINARYDMLAIKWPSMSQDRRKLKNIPLSLIEVKYGDGAVGGAAGIKKHIDDYIEFRKKPMVLEEIAKDMAEVFKKKHELGLVTSYPERKMEGFTIDSDDIEYLFVFANHNPDKSKIKQELEESIRKYEGEGVIDEIKVASASEMGYGLFAYKDGQFRYPSIREYVKKL